jgi:hypothetical protein
LGGPFTFRLEPDKKQRSKQGKCKSHRHNVALSL